jgi:hypothetical protein
MTPSPFAKPAPASKKAIDPRGTHEVLLTRDVLNRLPEIDGRDDTIVNARVDALLAERDRLQAELEQLRGRMDAGLPGLTSKQLRILAGAADVRAHDDEHWQRNTETGRRVLGRLRSAAAAARTEADRVAALEQDQAA